MTVFRLNSCSVDYGRLRALNDVTLELEAGSVVLVSGHNGAGKTTMVNVIGGLVGLGEGQVEFGGRTWHCLQPGELAPLGVAVVPSGQGVFASLTVRENLGVALPRGRQERADALDRLWRLFPDIEARQVSLAGSLSGGERQQLSIAMALAEQPRVLVLDEPSAGVSPMVTQSFARVLGEIASQGTAVLVTEQNLGAFLPVATRAVILKRGRVVLDEPAEQMNVEALWELF